MKIDKILVSSNDNTEYLEFSAIIGKAWKKLLPKTKVILICITDKTPEQFSSINKYYDDIIYIKNTLNIPSGNHAMASRMLIASSMFKNDIIMLSDIDMLPLNSNFFIDNIKDISDDKLVLLGGNAYNSKVKFPICYMIAKGLTFSEILNPENLDYNCLLYKMTQHTNIENLKNILKPYPTSGNCGRFDDEALFSDFYINWKDIEKRTKVINRNWNNGIAVDRIDRINWHLNMEDLKNNKIYDAHLPRPLSKNLDKISPLLKFLDIEL